MRINGSTIADILTERQQQEHRHGGPAHDDQLEPREWAAKIQRLFGELCDADRQEDSAKADKALVQIAATAIAGLESLRRKVVTQNADHSA